MQTETYLGPIWSAAALRNASLLGFEAENGREEKLGSRQS
jgi:hypothetical protein